MDTGPPDTDGPQRLPVVLLHGIFCSSWAWRFNIEALARGGRRVIAPCQKGFGWSARSSGGHRVEDLSAFMLDVLGALGVDRAHFVGNSLGGSVALRIAIDQPQRVQSLTLINPAAIPLRLPRALFSPKFGALAPVAEALSRKPLVRAGLQALAYRGLKVDDAYLNGFLTPLRQKGTMKGGWAVLSALYDGLKRLEPRLREVKQPTMLVWGQRDRVLPARHGRLIAQHIPHARFVPEPHLGHCTHEESPRRFNALLQRFLDANEEAGAADDDGLGAP